MKKNIHSKTYQLLIYTIINKKIVESVECTSILSTTVLIVFTYVLNSPENVTIHENTDESIIYV